jgi:hypothetical protein
VRRQPSGSKPGALLIELRGSNGKEWRKLGGDAPHARQGTIRFRDGPGALVQFGFREKVREWQPRTGSNRQPSESESDALPIELQGNVRHLTERMFSIANQLRRETSCLRGAMVKRRFAKECPGASLNQPQMANRKS